MNDIFENGYIEITLPVNVAEFPEQYGYLIDPFRNCTEFKECSACRLTLTVIFNTAEHETLFNLNADYIFPDDSSYSESDCNISFDYETAEMFRGQAMQKLLHNFNGMAICRHTPKAVNV